MSYTHVKSHMTGFRKVTSAIGPTGPTGSTGSTGVIGMTSATGTAGSSKRWLSNKEVAALRYGDVIDNTGYTVMVLSIDTTDLLLIKALTLRGDLVGGYSAERIGHFGSSGWSRLE